MVWRECGGGEVGEDEGDWSMYADTEGKIAT